MPSTSAYGEAFEHFVILEFHKLVQTLNPDIRLTFFRTSDGLSEIDLIVERPGKAIVLIEIKSATRIDEKTVSKLKRFEKDFQPPHLLILCNEPRARKSAGVDIMPWAKGIQKVLGYELPAAFRKITSCKE